MDDVLERFDELKAEWTELLNKISKTKICSGPVARQIATAYTATVIKKYTSDELWELFTYACATRGLDPELRLAGKKQGFKKKGRPVSTAPAFSSVLINLAVAEMLRRKAQYAKRDRTLREKRRQRWVALHNQ